MDTYLTLAAPSAGLYKEKGSRFLSFAYPVRDEAEARQLIAEREREYHDARHHCYAWRLGADRERYKLSDDGEPSGTAGRPILGQLLAADLTYALIVVVRYFGGIKLGTGGLTVAYKTAAADALANATIVQRTFDTLFDVHFPYLAMNAVMRVVKDLGCDVQDQTFEAQCTLRFRLRNSLAHRAAERLATIEGLTLRQQRQE